MRRTGSSRGNVRERVPDVKGGCPVFQLKIRKIARLRAIPDIA
jgi:hypothetical protein